MGKDRRSQVTIVGLGMVGASIGLALHKEKGKFRIVGHDKNPEATKRALKFGAVEKASWNLINACDEASLIILAIPFGEIRATMDAIGREIRQGVLVIDTATLKKPVQAWADEYLTPKGIAYLGGDPVLPMAEKRGFEAPNPNLFERRTFCFCPTTETPEGAIKVASDLADRLRAAPLFLDADEHDALRAGVEHFPMMLSAALLSSTAGNEAWREIRRLAGRRFEEFTKLPESPEGLSTIFLANRDNLVRWIDMHIQVMAYLKSTLVSGDKERIEKMLEASEELRNEWLEAAASGRWEEPIASLEKDSFLARMFGLSGILYRRKK